VSTRILPLLGGIFLSKVQTIFTEDGIKPTRSDLTPRQLRRYSKSFRVIKKKDKERAVCPFCGMMSTQDKFMYITKAHIVSKMYQCPRCEQKMYEPTLKVFNKGPEEYSKWFWSQFYEWDNRSRLDVANVKKLVREMGFGDIFWDTWKQYKEEFTSQFEDDE
jgi:hypothetical protein